MSKSSKQVPPPVALPPKKSKLSILASSRSNVVSSRSESSRFSGIALSGSVKTFPALRPSAQSAQPPDPSTRAPTSANRSEHKDNGSTIGPSTSSVVRRAIQTALELEAIDEEAPKTRLRPSPPKIEDTPEVRSRPSSQSSEHPVREVHTFGVPATRPPSKLLAMAKANANKNARLPKPVTEYLTPVANGSTVTTAITTSYQTLHTLTDPTISRVIPEQYVVPLGASPPEQRQSKLALKMKKANAKPTIAVPQEEEITPPLLSPVFDLKPSAHVRASPSAFASMLVDDTLIPSEDKKERLSPHTEEMCPVHGTPQKDRRRSQRRRKSDRLPPPEPSSPTSFNFEGPSPDDIVFNARRGTSLAQQKHLPLSTSTPRKQVSK